MRRFELSAIHRDVIDRPQAEVLGFLGDLPGALGLFPWVVEVRELERNARYAVAVGPFGVGSFQGTVRVEVKVTRQSERMLVVESVPDAGNTDMRATIEVEPSTGEVGDRASRVRIELWASPRRDVPALLPVSLVQGVARRTVERSLADGIRRLRAHLDPAEPAEAAPALSPLSGLRR